MRIKEFIIALLLILLGILLSAYIDLKKIDNYRTDKIGSLQISNQSLKLALEVAQEERDNYKAACKELRNEKKDYDRLANVVENYEHLLNEALEKLDRVLPLEEGDR